jgi:DNA-binding response OmpR family regulator
MAKIIIAEDEKDIRELIAFTLRYVGHDVFAYSNGEEAWINTLVEMPDLIILDIRMPVMSGYEVCEKIKANPLTEQIPVVFLTSKGQEEEIKTGFDHGALDYLLKPFAPEELNKTVQSILSRNQTT